MKLYAVVSGIEYKGSSVDVIFDSREKALSYIKKKYPNMKSTDDEGNDFENTSKEPFIIDYVNIHEYELNQVED